MESPTETFLGSQDNRKVVENCYEASKYHELVECSDESAARVKDKIALYILYGAIGESDFEKIVSVKSSKEAWDILEKVYKGNDWVKQETKGVAEYITRVKIVMN